MKPKELALTAEMVRERLAYNPLTGELTWRSSNRNHLPVDGVAGWINGRGRRKITIGGRPYFAHRVAWLYVYGKWPSDQIDHINGDPLDNRIANLRDVSQFLNEQNQHRAQANNKTGYIGVSRRANALATKPYRACIQVRGRGIHLGSYETADAARDAYLSAKRSMHPEAFAPEVEAARG